MDSYQTCTVFLLLEQKQVASNRLIILNGKGPNQKKLLKPTRTGFRKHIFGSQSYYISITTLLSY